MEIFRVAKQWNCFVTKWREGGKPTEYSDGEKNTQGGSKEKSFFKRAHKQTDKEASDDIYTESAVGEKTWCCSLD